MWLALLSTALVGFQTAAAAPAASWVDSLFPESTHHLGTVARGSRIKYRFPIVNTTRYDVHIRDWQTKCGCTDVTVGARTIPAGTQTFVEATLDTTRFEGPKSSGLVLNFDRPALASKDLTFECVIRGDIQLSPGGVDFGLVTRGSSPEQSLLLSYNGTQPNWGILGIDTISPNLKIDASEVPNTRQGSSVQYRLVAKLEPTAPVGYFKDEIVLKTNDASSAVIPISASGHVQGAVVVSPSILTLGTFKPGQSVSREVLVKSAKPFTVTSAVAAKGSASATAPQDAPRALQKVTATFKMPDQPGNYHFLVELHTSLDKEPPATLSAFATVAP